MIVNVIQDKNGIITSVNVSIKHCICKKMPGILAYVLKSLTRKLRLVNIWKTAPALISLVDNLQFTIIYDNLYKYPIELQDSKSLMSIL